MNYAWIICFGSLLYSNLAYSMNAQRATLAFDRNQEHLQGLSNVFEHMVHRLENSFEQERDRRYGACISFAKTIFDKELCKFFCLRLKKEYSLKVFEQLYNDPDEDEKSIKNSMKDIFQIVLLYKLVELHDCEAVSLLLAKNVCSSYAHFDHIQGITPLHLATRLGHTDSMKLFLDKQWNVNVVPFVGGSQKFHVESPLHTAFKHHQYGAASVLLSYGAKLNECDSEGVTACDAMKRGLAHCLVSRVRLFT